MTNVLIITHGNLAQEFIKIAEAVTGKECGLTAVCLDMEKSSEEYDLQIKQAIEQANKDKQVLILTDLFGGTASNKAIRYVEKNRVEVISGLNLAMLIYLVTQKKDKPFSELCHGIKKSGEDAVVIAGEFLS